MRLRTKNELIIVVYRRFFAKEFSTGHGGQGEKKIASALVTVQDQEIEISHKNPKSRISHLVYFFCGKNL
jgi:hypothetical protein